MYQNKEPFPYNSQDTAIALSATGVEQGFVADQLMPYIRVNNRLFKWRKHSFGDELQTTDDIVSEKGQLNSVEFSGELKSDSVVDRGLSHTYTSEQVQEMGGPRAVSGRIRKLTNVMLRNREKRVNDAVKNPANASQVLALSSADRIGESGVKSIDIIEDLRLSMLFPGNILAASENVISKIRRAPDVIKAFNGTLGDDGMVPVDWLAQYYNVERIVMGKARQNSASKGLAAQIDRVWDNDFLSLIFQRPNITTDSLQEDVTWGATPRWHGPEAPNGRVAGRKRVDVGLHGATEIRTGESVKELVLCTECMALVQNPVNFS